MSVQDVCAIIGTALLAIGALGSLVVWLFGIGNKLGGIETNTKNTAAGLEHLNKQMDVHSEQLMEHSHQFRELHVNVAGIREDVTVLQKRIPGAPQ